ncbi:type II toxin-antitoxin system RelE/ParE family toxin [Catalinimonas sp. 4WD22]|uniref:type II toxin-antitoxin system RelE/ParE family toxin n=1 Tax=Catalinimonas locisalis TaxID=3133978 RepID=UPI0031015F96
MIKSFRHKGLKKFFEKGDLSGINPTHTKKVRKIMVRLNSATELKDLNYPGGGLHKLKGDLEGHLALKVTGNWRITFLFEDGDVYVVDYQDYH